MRAKEVLDVCEQLEYMAGIGRGMLVGIPPDGDVLIRVNHEDADRQFIHLAGFFWACRPEAKRS